MQPSTRQIFHAPSWMIDTYGAVPITLIGAGGTGGEVLDQLCRLHATLVALGHPGLDVTVYDGDTVSASNIGRQRFSSLEIGHNKAVALINRINLFYGIGWSAVPYHWQTGDALRRLIITATDSAALRHAIARENQDHRYFGSSDDLWLDFGNGQQDGQAVLGHRYKPTAMHESAQQVILPHIIDLYPDMQDGPDTGPSCSVEAAIRQQAFGINSALVTAAFASLVWPLFRHGRVDRHGLFIDVATGQTTPLHIDAVEWAMFDYTPGHKIAS